MKKSVKLILGAGSLLTVLGVAAGFSHLPVFADTSTILNPGSDIQVAINEADPGDTITLKAGEYTGSLYIDKSINLKGEDGAILKDNNSSARQAIKIYDTSNVTIENITVDGTGTIDQPWDSASTGIDINSASDVAIKDVTIEHFGKNGLSVVAKQYPTNTIISNNISIENLSVADTTGGVSIYTRSTDGEVADIDNLVFSGITSISDSDWGFKLNDTEAEAGGPQANITGDDGELDLSTIELNNVVEPISDNLSSQISLAPQSEVNGVVLANMTDEQLVATLGLPAGSNIVFNDGSGVKPDDTTPILPPATGNL